MSLKVTIIENGPLIIHNESNEAMTVNDELVGKKIALCRCGKNEIYCDGSHKFKTIETTEHTHHIWDKKDIINESLNHEEGKE